MSQNTPTIGVLALQGAFEAHAKVLESLGATARLVRTPAELEGLDGLIIPGGESTTTATQITSSVPPTKLSVHAVCVAGSSQAPRT